jgi:uncharacterized membrane protein
VAAGRLSRWILLLAAALAMITRAPVYLTAPSFWAEEGTLYFAAAWNESLGASLVYRPAGYLLLWANIATTVAARLARGGLLSLVHAPQVTVLFALVAQLVPVAVIAWSRAPFWGGPGRRAAGVVLVITGVLTDEIWLNTVNSQPWLVLAAALLLLEPPACGRRRARAETGLVALAGLTAPATSALLPLFAWRAWRARTRHALALASVVAICALVQVWCLWAAMRAGQALPSRSSGLDVGVFAATVWMRTLIVPLLGTDRAQAFGTSIMRAGGIGTAIGATLLALAGLLVGWLARGLRPGDRGMLAGAYALVTSVTFLTAVGDKAMLLHTPWTSSRYAFTPGVLVLLMVLGCVRRGAGALRAAPCALLLVLAMVRGAMQYPGSVRWKPSWPVWSEQVHAWEMNPQRPLEIWPPPWALSLPAPATGGAHAGP